MKTNNNKADLIPASRAKKKSVKSKLTAKKVSSTKSTIAQKKLGATVKVIAPMKVACATKKARAKSSSIARRTAKRVSNIADPSVERYSRTSARTGDPMAKRVRYGLDAKGNVTKQSAEMGAATRAASNQVLSPNSSKGNNMKLFREFTSRQGKIGYILAWAIGIPVPLLIIVFLLRGCN